MPRPACETVAWSLEPGAWSLEPGAWSLEPGAWSLEPGAGSREPGAGSREPGAGSREPGAGSREPGAGSREPGAGLGQRGRAAFRNQAELERSGCIPERGRAGAAASSRAEPWAGKLHEASEARCAFSTSRPRAASAAAPALPGTRRVPPQHVGDRPGKVQRAGAASSARARRDPSRSPLAAIPDGDAAPSQQRLHALGRPGPNRRAPHGPRRPSIPARRGARSAAGPRPPPRPIHTRPPRSAQRSRTMTTQDRSSRDPDHSPHFPNRTRPA